MFKNHNKFKFFLIWSFNRESVVSALGPIISHLLGFFLYKIIEFSRDGLLKNSKTCNIDIFAEFLAGRQIVRNLKKIVCKLITTKKMSFSSSEDPDQYINNYYHGKGGSGGYQLLSTRSLSELETTYLTKCETILWPVSLDEDSDIELPRAHSDNTLTPVQTTENPETATYTNNHSDPFDFRTTKWITGEHVIRVNKPVPDSNFPVFVKPAITVAQKTIKIASINIPMTLMHSNTNYFFDLVEFYQDIDILGICEMYLKNTIQLEIPPGYDFWSNGKGNDITTAFLTKKHLKRNISFSEPFVNCSAIKVNLGQKKSEYVILMELYRSPGEMSDRFINNGIIMSREKYKLKLRDLISTPSKKLILMGDFNYDLNSISDRKFRNREERFLTDLLRDSPFSNVTEGYKTHWSKIHNTTTSTDMVLVVPGIEISNVEVNEQDLFHGLDHFPITFEIAHFFKKPPRKKIRSRGKIYKNSPFCKNDDNLNLTREFTNLKKWEHDNYGNLKKANDNWDKNIREGTIGIYREFIKMIDNVMPVKTIVTKSGNSRFPLSHLYWV